MFLRFLAFLIPAMAALSVAARPETSLPPTVAKALAAAQIPSSAVGVVVQEVGATTPRLELNAGTAMNPASTMKLVTTLAALELLGPAYTWKTSAWSNAPLDNGVLAGDLVLRGGADPRLTFEQFWLLLRQVRARGVRQIAGDLELDRAPAQLQGRVAAPGARCRQANGDGAGGARAGESRHHQPDQAARRQRRLRRLEGKPARRPEPARQPLATGADRRLSGRLRRKNLEPWPAAASGLHPRRVRAALAGTWGQPQGRRTRRRRTG